MRQLRRILRLVLSELPDPLTPRQERRRSKRNGSRPFERSVRLMRKQRKSAVWQRRLLPRPKLRRKRTEQRLRKTRRRRRSQQLRPKCPLRSRTAQQRSRRSGRNRMCQCEPANRVSHASLASLANQETRLKIISRGLPKEEAGGVPRANSVARATVEYQVALAAAAAVVEAAVDLVVRVALLKQTERKASSLLPAELMTSLLPSRMMDGRP